MELTVCPFHRESASEVECGVRCGGFYGIIVEEDFCLRLLTGVDSSTIAGDFFSLSAVYGYVEDGFVSGVVFEIIW